MFFRLARISTDFFFIWTSETSPGNKREHAVLDHILTLLCLFASTEMCITLYADLRDLGFFSSYEDLQTVEVCSDVQIYHILKLWLLIGWRKSQKYETKMISWQNKRTIKKQTSDFLTRFLCNSRILYFCLLFFFLFLLGWDGLLLLRLFLHGWEEVIQKIHGVEERLSVQVHVQWGEIHLVQRSHFNKHLQLKWAL